MSTTPTSTNTPTTTPTTATTNNEETTSSKKDNKLFGIDFNDPTTLAGVAIGGLILGGIGLHLARTFIFKEPVPTTVIPTNQQRKRPMTAEELRQAEYQRELDRHNQTRKLSEEQEYLENLRRYGIVEENNRNLKKYNVHKSYSPGPIVSEDIESNIEVIDDNIFDYNNVQFQRDMEQQQQHQQQQRPIYNTHAQQSRKQQQLSPQPLNDSLTLSDEDIQNYTDNEIDENRIPAEFVNVGNRPEAFQNIKPVSRPKEQVQSDDDMYNIENMEIDEDTLKKLESNAYSANTNNNDYYK